MNKKENSTPVRILQIVSSAYVGSGVLQVVLNWHRRLDRSKVQFDYLFLLPTCHSCQAEIEALGGRVEQLPNIGKNPFRFLKSAVAFFRQHRYLTIHSHITHLNLLFFPLAKFFGAKTIIQHAHGTQYSDKALPALRNRLMLGAVRPLITHQMACSTAAGKFYFGKKFTLVNNAIELEKFTYTPQARAEKRKELGVENLFVIGHIGRFNEQKNHTFLVDTFAEAVKLNPQCVLLLVGSGPLEEKIKAKVRLMGLDNKVKFLGARRDTPALLQAFDVFCMPSFYEGLPLAAVEAQAAGLACVLSCGITDESVLLPCSGRLPLEAGPEAWAQRLLTQVCFERKQGIELLKQKGFDISDSALQMQKFYESMPGGTL
ncbi:MAG: glycosyltransferase family 1 protein [Elusimicrobiaceae bacterium]|nr:glycosyltransferase family 1 protein [Elusimicrobiaceae bacterium]MBR3603477.1 glycosyltransferase family 1 protein [Elusimicrobiaceae bacterium]